MEVNQIISNNLKDFFLSGFNSNFDHNISQIIQRFVDESKEMITKLLDDTRENIVNSSNFDELMNFTTLSFSEIQKKIGLKHDNFTLQPVDYSTNNVDMKTEILIPGSDKIIHIYKLDGCIKIQKSTNNLLFSILKLYKGFSNELKPQEMKNKITNCVNFDHPDDMIVPMSYCIPMNYNYGNCDIDQTYKPGIINIYTHIDKDDFYRMMLNTLFYSSINIFNTNILDLSNFKNLYRSILQMILVELNKIDIVSTLLTSVYIEKFVKIAIAKSTFGSISKFYDNMTTYGVRGYVINEFKRIIKTRKTSETWGNRGYSSKNPVDVIFGSRGMDHIFNFVIDELMTKKLFDRTGSRSETIFEFIISNAISYVIASGSLCIGQNDSIKSMDNLMGEITDEYKVIFPYIEEISKEYYKINDDLINSLISLTYGTFIVKHIYDTKHRIQNNSFFTMKEFNYVTGLLENAGSIINENIYKISAIIEKFMPIGYFNNDEYDDRPVRCSDREDGVSKSDPDRLENILNPGKMYDHLQNVICRLITMPTLMRICKNLRSIDRNIWDIREKAMQNPVADDTNISKESDEWVFKNLFSKSTENIIEKFVGDCRVGGNINNFCNQLKKDVIIGIESSNDEILSNVIRKSIKIYDIVNFKNASEEDVKTINETLVFVADKMSIIN